MKEDEGQNLVFHYNRERRLEKAPEEVRRSYDQGNTPKGGFLHGLTANSGLRSILVVIILLCASVVFLTLFGETGNSVVVEGAQIHLAAFLYEETVYITVSCKGANSTVLQNVPVHVLISGLDPNNVVVFEQELNGIFFNNELILRTTMHDYELKTIGADLKFNNSDAKLSVSVDRK